MTFNDVGRLIAPETASGARTFARSEIKRSAKSLRDRRAEPLSRASSSGSYLPSLESHLNVTRRSEWKLLTFCITRDGELTMRLVLQQLVYKR